MYRIGLFYSMHPNIYMLTICTLTSLCLFHSMHPNIAMYKEPMIAQNVT